MTETMPLSVKHILGTRDMNQEDIITILDTADSFKEIATVPLFALVLVFFIL